MMKKFNMFALIALSLAVAGNVDAGRPSVRHVVENGIDRIEHRVEDDGGGPCFLRIGPRTLRICWR